MGLEVLGSAGAATNRLSSACSALLMKIGVQRTRPSHGDKQRCGARLNRGVLLAPLTDMLENGRLLHPPDLSALATLYTRVAA